jgi:hypothetical protein
VEIPPLFYCAQGADQPRFTFNAAFAVGVMSPGQGLGLLG